MAELVRESVLRLWLRGSGVGAVGAVGWAMVKRFGEGVLPHSNMADARLLPFPRHLAGPKYSPDEFLKFR